MCLIAYSPKGTYIPDDILNYACAQNNDGIGVMCRESVTKFLGKKMLKRAKRVIKQLVDAEIPYAVHFRWATHGKVNLINTHPYKSPQGEHYIMHNGIITTGDCTTESSADESDTAVYVRKFLQEMPRFEDDKKFYTDMGAHIGWGNKFCIMDSDGHFQIVNEGAGTWIGGVWYSNTYSLPAAKANRFEGGWMGGHGDYYSRAHNMTVHSAQYNDSEWLKYGGEGATCYLEAVKQGFTWDYTIKKWLKKSAVTAVVLSGNKDYPNRSLTTSSALNPPIRIGADIDYYAALEAGMNEDEAAEYADTGYLPEAKSLSEELEEEFEAGELAALREEQGRLLAAAYDSGDKPESPIGGDFGAGYDDDEGQDDDESPEDRNKFRKYLARVAANIHVK